MGINIRNEETKDLERVREIVTAAFPTDAESRLVDALRANGKAIISLVAVDGDDVLGHILFSPVTTTPSSKGKGLGLAPVAVRPNVQAQGIGSKLIRQGLRLCKELGYDYCVVLGNPHYYQRFGFEWAGPFGIRNEYGVDHEFMVIQFSDGGVSGLVQYASEFSVFSV
ncbi:MAG TPA: N-acetyltransferase [Anaerolineales bacterium]|nr:N-acetyltransferase [Anaerolineales bacterium]